MHKSVIARILVMAEEIDEKELLLVAINKTVLYFKGYKILTEKNVGSTSKGKTLRATDFVA